MSPSFRLAAGSLRAIGKPEITPPQPSVKRHRGVYQTSDISAVVSPCRLDGRSRIFGPSCAHRQGLDFPSEGLLAIARFEFRLPYDDRSEPFGEAVRIIGQHS